MNEIHIWLKTLRKAIACSRYIYIGVGEYIIKVTVVTLVPVAGEVVVAVAV